MFLLGAEGATDLEIHDTVLIAVVYCMCNRYVGGLSTWAPQDAAIYRARAAQIVEHGYTGRNGSRHCHPGALTLPQ